MECDVSEIYNNEGEEGKSSILVADDHVFLAEAIAESLSLPPRKYKTQITGTHLGAIEALRQNDTAFDLVLLDLHMPQMEGLKSVLEVIAAAKPTKVALISGNADLMVVQEAVKHGAVGFVPKTLPLKSFLSVIDLLLSGQVFLPAEFSVNPYDAKLQDIKKLSTREISVLRLASEGLTNKEIASAIDSNENMIKMHMRSICRKIGARNRTHSVKICKESGLF